MKTFQERCTMSHWRAALAALSAASALFVPLSSWAQNTIQSITSSQQAGTEVVRIELSEPLAAVPNGFSVQAPPRIAIDLPGVATASAAAASRSTKAICARPTWPRPVTARAWC